MTQTYMTKQTLRLTCDGCKLAGLSPCDGCSQWWHSATGRCRHKEVEEVQIDIGLQSIQGCISC